MGMSALGGLQGVSAAMGNMAPAANGKASMIDCFLKIDSLEGESADSRHKGEIQVESWSWGETQSGTHGHGGGGGAGRVVMQDFHFTMKVSKASPKLMLACASGEHFQKVVLTCRKAGKDQQEYLRIIMQDVIVSSFQVVNHIGVSVVPMESISLNFGKIVYDYKEQKADGSLGASHKTGWDKQASQKL